MPPQRTQLSCPRCRQPITAIVEQLFDVTADPGAKQRLLGGVSNTALCQNCGFSGPLATPIVYHDAEKELLLTYFPPELNTPVNDQEKLFGPMITQVTNKLSPEKRKAYLLRPQSFLTYQSLIERILGADGITPEMIQAQQKRVNLIERLLSASSPEIRGEMIKQENSSFDAEFFAIFSRLMESTIASGQDKLSKQMEELQQVLFSETEYGRKIGNQYQETQEAIKTLQAAGKSLDRAKLLSILIEAPNDDRINALVSMTRPGLDYQFFQLLSESIEAKSGTDRQKLEDLRTKLLELTRKLDQRMEEEVKNATLLLDTLLKADDIKQATAQHMQEFNEIFIQVLNQAVQEANQKNDTEQMPKLQQIIEVLQQASAPPAELALLEKFLEAPDEAALNRLFEDHASEITPELTSIIGNIVARSEGETGEKPAPEEAQMLEKIQQVYRALLKFNMKKNLN